MSLSDSSTAAQNPCSHLNCVIEALCVFSSDHGYYCVCSQGLVGDGIAGGTGCHIPDGGCNSYSPCDIHATCSVVSGSFSCHCQSGYSGDGFSNGSGCRSKTNCTVYYYCGTFLSPDINECSTNPCVSNANCSDSDGSFSCICNRGYLGDGLLLGSGCEGKFDGYYCYAL